MNGPDSSSDRSSTAEEHLLRVVYPEHPAAVLSIGHATLDAIYHVRRFATEPVKVPVEGYHETIGGMGANAACAMARLGARAYFCGPIGRDDFAMRVRQEFVRAGVDTGWIVDVPEGQTSHSTIIVDAAGERMAYSLRGSALQAAIPHELCEEVEHAFAVHDIRAVCVDVRWGGGAEVLAQRARACGLAVVLDGEMGNADLVRALMPHADHRIFSERGFMEVVGHTVESEPGRAALAAQLDGQVALVAVTCGSHGVYYALRGSGVVRHLPAYPSRSVETLGAGDVFHGAYALQIARRALTTQAGVAGNTRAAGGIDLHDLENALHYAAAAAAIKCSRPGGRSGLPAHREVLALLAACGFQGVPRPSPAS